MGKVPASARVPDDSKRASFHECSFSVYEDRQTKNRHTVSADEL